MGTRSISVVKDRNGNKIIEMYKQYDGYPEGLGRELADFIKSGQITNGIPVGGNKEKLFNGIGCFTAQLVAYFKEGAGGIYLEAPTTDYKDKREYNDLYGAQYYYEIDSNLNLRAWCTCTGEEVSHQIKEV